MGAGRRFWRPRKDPFPPALTLMTKFLYHSVRAFTVILCLARPAGFADAPRGQMLKKGEGYFSDYELFLPGIAYGVTDNVTIGGGVSLFPAAVEDQVYYVTPKIGISVADKVHVAAGVLFARTHGGTGGIY